MSVIQSKRKESELEFLKLLRDIEAIFIRMSVNKPRKYKHILDKMIDMSMEALNYAKTANSIYVENQLQFDTRQTYFKQSIAKVYAISSQIEILRDVFRKECISDGQLKELSKKSWDAIKCLKGVIATDKKRWNK